MTIQELSRKVREDMHALKGKPKHGQFINAVAKRLGFKNYDHMKAYCHMYEHVHLLQVVRQISREVRRPDTGTKRWEEVFEGYLAMYADKGGNLMVRSDKRMPKNNIVIDVEKLAEQVYESNKGCKDITAFDWSEVILDYLQDTHDIEGALSRLIIPKLEGEDEGV